MNDGASGIQIAVLLIVCIAALVMFGWIARDMWGEHKKIQSEELNEVEVVREGNIYYLRRKRV